MSRTLTMTDLDLTVKHPKLSTPSIFSMMRPLTTRHYSVGLTKTEAVGPLLYKLCERGKAEDPSGRSF